VESVYSSFSCENKLPLVFASRIIILVFQNIIYFDFGIFEMMLL